MKKILITSVGTSTSIGLIKKIKELGEYIIYGTDINDYGYTAGSLLVDFYYKVHLATDSLYMTDLENIIKKEGIDLVIPINDCEIQVLSKNSFDLCKIIIPSYVDIKKIANKFICSDFLMNKKIDVPKFVNLPYNDKYIIRDKFGVGSKGIKICCGSEENTITDNQFIQEFINGEEYTVDVLNNIDGVPLYIIPRKRLEVKSGVATKVLIENNTELINIVKQILKYYKIPGFCNIQFIHSKYDDKYYFIEINYRFGGCSISSLISAPKMIQKFLDVCFNNLNNNAFNEDVNWNLIITRYYQEVVYKI